MIAEGTRAHTRHSVLYNSIQSQSSAVLGDRSTSICTFIEKETSRAVAYQTHEICDGFRVMVDAVQ